MPNTVRQYNKQTQITPQTHLKPGQAIVMNMNAPSTEKAIGWHPWLILHADEEAIEIIQCSTNTDEERGKNREGLDVKYAMNNSFNDHGPKCFYIKADNQYPPFSQNKAHTTAVMLEERIIIPLPVLYEMEDVHFYSDNGKNKIFNGQLDKTVLNRIKKESYEAQKETYDPYRYLDLGIEAFIKHQIKRPTQSNFGNKTGSEIDNLKHAENEEVPTP